MSQQQSIFDESFDQSLTVDRKRLLSIALKIYLCVIFFLAAWTIVYRTYGLVYLLNSENFPFYNSDIKRVIVGNYVLAVITAIAWILMAYFVLKGKRWAIRFNLGVAIIWGIAAVADMIFSLPFNPPSIQSFLLFVPYWVMLLLIRKRWDNS
ncbi:hypothetical protein [Chitinophaga agri]|uniref:DUF2569 domain-containing protein n=1 Tax=Chitinophaga agri TaxID=2703787 RepID=A0A6B9ZES2_9BACT|nr:hypothetical protein [Chitinophaga agri]QHS60870.1 hypothetical protein GWR21_15090 [Chitinophaga agri]